MVSGQVSKLIGAAVKRKEDPRLITGEGKYTGDVQLSGMTYMAVLRSPHAHAHIRRIDAARALQQPGVLAVLTGHRGRATLSEAVSPRWRQGRHAHQEQMAHGD